jgi:hypothetical protein
MSNEPKDLANSSLTFTPIKQPTLFVGGDFIFGEGGTVSVIAGSYFSAGSDEGGAVELLGAGQTLTIDATSANFSLTCSGELQSPFEKQNTIIKGYDLIKKYEKKYTLLSSEMFEMWKKGDLPRNSEINEWLDTYLEIKDFILV